MLNCSVWAPLIWIVEQFVNMLPNWSVVPPGTAMATAVTMMGRMNQFLPITEIFLLFSIFHLIGAALIAYRTGRVAVMMIRGCG